jgi:putative membrane protein
MVRLILRLVVNAIALYVTTLLNIGVSFNGQWWQIVIVAFIFGLVNAVVRPILNFFTCPLILLTLGLFTLVINALMLMLTAWISHNWFSLGFQVNDFWAAFIGGLVVSIISFALNIFVRDAKDDDR